MHEQAAHCWDVGLHGRRAAHIRWLRKTGGQRWRVATWTTWLALILSSRLWWCLSGRNNNYNIHLTPMPPSPALVPGSMARDRQCFARAVQGVRGGHSSRPVPAPPHTNETPRGNDRVRKNCPSTPSPRTQEHQKHNHDHDHDHHTQSRCANIP